MEYRKLQQRPRRIQPKNKAQSLLALHLVCFSRTKNALQICLFLLLGAVLNTYYLGYWFTFKINGALLTFAAKSRRAKIENYARSLTINI